jgi:hypothetical protein
MELKNILADLQGIGGDGMSKSASDGAPKGRNEKTASARDELVGALNDVLKPAPPPAQTKTAADAQPAQDGLDKMAAAITGSEGELLVKEANIYGAAVADGFMARIGQYEGATAGMQPTTKIASADGVPTEEEFNKFASENPDLVKQAMELGYHHGRAQIEELKKVAFAQGYRDASAEIEELSKTAAGREKLAALAADLEKQASAEDGNVFQKLAATPAGREKLAAAQQGYRDTAAEIEKTANDCFERGYRDTVGLLRAM